MAQPSKTKVTRISATDTKKTKKPTKTAKLSKAKAAVKTNASTVDKPVMAPAATKTSKKSGADQTPTSQTKNPFKAFWVYVKGAWYELQQVRWPNRANTWSMTGALLAFTAFFLLVIIVLDAGFKYLFQIILGA